MKPTGIVLGSFSPLHMGHMNLIMQAKKECGDVLIVVCGFKNDKGEKVGIPLSLREELIKKTFENDPIISVISICDDDYGISGYDNQWETWLDAVWKKSCIPGYVVKSSANFYGKVTQEKVKNENLVFYVAEQEYYDAIIGQGHKAVLVDRNTFPISATKIRENPMKYWNYIAIPFRPYFQKKILIIGTASEGKTTLTKDLCTYFGVEGTYEFGHEVMEYRRESDEVPTDQHLTFDDFKSFLDVQYERNTEITANPTKLRICDSDASTTMMYAEDYTQDERYDLSKEDLNKLWDYANSKHMFIKYDKIFVIPPHAEFVQDGTRDELKGSIEERKKQYQQLMKILENHYYYDNFVFLRGNFWENFVEARNEIIKLM